MPIPSPIRYPDLPVVQKREEFLRLLKQHGVLIVKADTGSGKSTQLPKFLLESGLAEKGRIGVTQPRRLAALSIADRLREELAPEGAEPANDLVATRIRFLEEGDRNAPIKVMTDGILLQEFRKDRLLRQYSAIMLDEAHERSLNIDILLGIFKSVVAARPEFRLIVASATLDAQLFQEFYPGSAVLEAEGRTYPVTVEYQAPRSDDSDDKGQRQRKDAGKAKGDSGLLDEAEYAILDLLTRHPDHLLCFLPTERDILDLAADLRAQLDEKRFDVLPLFGRMSPAEQRRVFHGSARTRVVLATNIAETSLTIPGIAYVVDTGTARVSRYNPSARIQGLPVEPISQASARQRTGRAGRVKPGTCIRLYSEAEFNDREEFTEPEIRRSNLANVVLQLRSLGLAVEEFPFLQPPPRTAFRGAYRLLHELGAIVQPEAGGDVTPLGQEMAKLPMDVALSAVLLRARDQGVLQPALIVCAGLSLQDPRITPPEDPERQKAREAHRKHAGHKSDFLSMLSVWNAFQQEWDGKGWNKLRRFCEKNWLHFLRCREWIDLYEQFCRILKVEFKDRVVPFDSFHRDFLHISLLGGFLGGVARRDIDAGGYKLVGGRECHLFPGSDLYGKSPEWVVAAEVRETSRVFLSRGTEIRPEWILQVAEPFCTRRWFDPQWNAQRGFVEVLEEVSFRGMVLTRGRRVDYARIDAAACAEIFFREAVTEAQMARPFPFMEANARVVDSLHGLEARLRRWGLAPTPERQIAWYLARAPHINSIKTLQDHIRKFGDKDLRFVAEDWLADQHDPSLLVQAKASESIGSRIQGKSIPAKAAANQAASEGTSEMFRLLGTEVPGRLVFDAARPDDGLSLRLPLTLWKQLSPAALALHLQQWRDWMLESLLRELPAATRKKAETIREKIDDAWCDQLEKHPDEAPLLLLYDVCAPRKEFDGQVPFLQPTKEHHLRLHLELADPLQSRSFALELQPDWGSAAVFQQLRNSLFPMVGGHAVEPVLRSDLPVGPWRYGWRLGRFAAMSPDESAFWQDFLTRTAQASVPGLADLFTDRLALLASGGLDLPGWECAPRELAFRSLLGGLTQEDESIRYWEKRLERFSGLEHARGSTVRTFQDLARKAPSEAEEIRLALVRLCYDSALLSRESFAIAWRHLRDCVLAMRRGQPPSRTWATLAERQQAAPSLYMRLREAARLLGNDEDLFIELQPLPQQTDAKAWREKFRPYLASRTIGEQQLKAVRQLLARIERPEDEDPFVLETTATVLLGECRMASYRHTGAPTAEDDEEQVDTSQLLKLKGAFGKIRK